MKNINEYIIKVTKSEDSKGKLRKDFIEHKLIGKTFKAILIEDFYIGDFYIIIEGNYSYQEIYRHNTILVSDIIKNI